MAGDARDGASPTATTTAKNGHSKKIDPYAVPVRPENANLLPGGTSNTAGGKMKEATFIDGLKSIRLSDLKEVHTKPCVRESFLTGIGAGFGIGGVRAILGAPVLVTCNWAVGSFVFGSFLMHEYCQRGRTLEKQGINRAVEMIKRKKSEKQLQAQDAGDASRRAKEAEEWVPKK